MNSLSWVLYFAEVMGNLGNLFFIIGLSTFGLGVFFIIPGYLATWQNLSDESLRIRANMAWLAPRAVAAGAVVLVVSLFLPSKETMYMIAASEIGEAVVTSDDAKDVYKELKDQILHNLRLLNGTTKQAVQE